MRPVLHAVAAVAALVATLVALPPSRALADDRSHEARTVAACEKLEGTQNVGERAQCLRCIARPIKHHYRADYPPGLRCRTDEPAKRR